MKITLKALVSVFAITSLLTFSGCGGDPTPAQSVEDQQLEKLSATWNISEVTLTGVSKKTTDYPTFSLVLSGTAGATIFGYSTSGRPSNSPWPPSGTWVFGGDPTTQIIRDYDKSKPDSDAVNKDKLDMTYTLSDDGKTLQINFTFNGTGYPARVSSVKGAWVFTFVKA